MAAIRNTNALDDIGITAGRRVKSYDHCGNQCTKRGTTAQSSYPASRNLPRGVLSQRLAEMSAHIRTGDSSHI